MGYTIVSPTKAWPSSDLLDLATWSQYLYNCYFTNFNRMSTQRLIFLMKPDKTTYSYRLCVFLLIAQLHSQKIFSHVGTEPRLPGYSPELQGEMPTRS